MGEQPGLSTQCDTADRSSLDMGQRRDTAPGVRKSGLELRIMRNAYAVELRG
jgi:hypothetical protein